MVRKAIGRSSEHWRMDGTAKTGFKTPAMGQKHAEHLRKVWRTGRELKVYQCGECRRWHVGKKQKRRTTG